MKDAKKLYINTAMEFADQSTCLRRRFGCVIVNRELEEIVYGSYNGAPRGMPHCQTCLRDELNIPSGSEYSICRSCHAEENALAKAGLRAHNCDIYLYGFDIATNQEINPRPCFWCTKLMINSKIHRVITKHAIFDPVELYYNYIQNMKVGVTIPTFDP